MFTRSQQHSPIAVKSFISSLIASRRYRQCVVINALMSVRPSRQSLSCFTTTPTPQTNPHVLRTAFGNKNTWSGLRSTPSANRDYRCPSIDPMPPNHHHREHGHMIRDRAPTAPHLDLIWPTALRPTRPSHPELREPVGQRDLLGTLMQPTTTHVVFSVHRAVSGANRGPFSISTR